MPYYGDVELGETLYAFVQIVDSNGTPVDADATPSVKVYDGDGFVAGPLTPVFGETAVITSVTNPNGTNCVVNSTSHGLMAGQRVTITGVVGHALAVNGTFNVVTVPNGNQFTINLTGNNGAAGTGGSWHTTGFYKTAIVATTGNGYEAGIAYTVHTTFTLSSVAKALTDTFLVV